MSLSPKTNLQLFGHEASLAQLLAGFAGKKMAHGWIISGPRGIGKATLIYHLTRSILSGLPPAEIAPDHPVSLRIAADSHSDLLVVEPLFDAKKEEFSREINVDQAREISRFLSLTPGEGQWRIVIIDSADALNTNGANAILKILEEPPPQALLFLISHNPGKLLPTIRSRCRHFSLKSLSKEHFLKAMAANAPELEKSTVIGLGELTNYSPGVALQYHESKAITVYNHIIDLFLALPALDAVKLHAFADKMMQGQAHANWQLFSKLMLCLLERIVLNSSGLPVNALSEQESALLRRMESIHPPYIWAKKWQETMDQFFLADRLHLDYKQFIIIFFHSLTSMEEFRIGNIAA